MKKNLKTILLAFAGLVIVAQFIRPDRTNPPVDQSLSVKSDSTVPPLIVAAFTRACFDCHSHETRWPWYSNITPVNFLIADDVHTGRKNLNFSEWGKQKLSRRLSILEEISDQVTAKDMPLPKYLLLHSDARLSADEIKTIGDWCDACLKSLSSPENPLPVKKKK